MTASGRSFQVFVHVAYGDLSAAASAVDERTCAVIVEPIQGESGVVVPPPEFLPGLREICDRKGCLLIFDEIQTGMGRCGTLFAYERAGVVPDVMTLAKGLASGLPMGACLAGPRAPRFSLPVPTRPPSAATRSRSRRRRPRLKATIEDGVCENCREAGNYFMEKLEKLSEKYDSIRQVRGRGLMIGVEVTGRREGNRRADERQAHPRQPHRRAGPSLHTAAYYRATTTWTR